MGQNYINVVLNMLKTFWMHAILNTTCCCECFHMKDLFSCVYTWSTDVDNINIYVILFLNVYLKS